MRDIAYVSMELVRKFGGVVSSEHGDGIVRAWLTEPLVGPELYEVYRRVKQIFDPANVLNPGKVVDALPLTENLRIVPGSEPRTFGERLDRSAHGGCARADERRNRSRPGRQFPSGLTCPRFLVAGEEERSTRGRANALRPALSGDVPPEDLTGDRMFE